MYKGCAGHGIAQEDFDRVLTVGQKFLALPEAEKTKWPFNPDTYLGHRGSKELETVTGVLQGLQGHRASACFFTSALHAGTVEHAMPCTCPQEAHMYAPACIELMASMTSALAGCRQSPVGVVLCGAVWHWWIRLQGSKVRG